MRFTSLAVAAFLLGASASPVRAQGFKRGFEVGAGMSTTSPTPAGETNSYGPGLLAGLYGSVQLFKPVGVQFEAIYVQKHSKATAKGVESEVRLDYFEIPILAKLSLFKGLYILEGIEFGFPVKANVRAPSGADTNIKDTTTNPDIGLIIGVVVPAGRIGLEGRYESGFKTIDSTGVAVVRNRSLFFVVRVPF